MAFESLLGSILGQQGGRNPRFVSDQGYEKSFNVTRRRVLAQTRPGQFQREITFPSDALREVFEKGKFQGAYEYATDTVTYSAVATDGNIFLIDTLTGCAFDLSGQVGRLSNAVDRIHFQQVNEFLVVQDGINRPYIVDGVSVRRSDPDAGEIPIGTFMSFGQNRMFVVPTTSDASQLLAGDIFIPQDRESVLRFTETQYLATGGSLAGGSSFGKITGLQFLPALDASTGLSGLVVSHERGMFSYNVILPRAQWGDVQIGRAIAFESGATSQEAFINIDNDLFFRGFDEVRSLSQSRADTNSFGNLRISAEMEEFVELDTQWLLNFASMTYFDNRMFVTTSPRRSIVTRDTDPRVDVTHKGLMVMDFRGSNGLTQVSRPVWEGVWTGLDITQVLTTVTNGQDQMFLFAKDAFGNNVLFEQSRSDFVDRTIDGTEHAIESRMYLRSYDFDSPFQTKQLGRIKLWLTDIRGDYDFKSFFRANNYAPWQPWGKCAEGSATMDGCVSDTFEIFPSHPCEDSETCTTADVSCSVAPPGQDQSRSNMNLGSGISVDGKVSDTGTASQGEEFQPRFDWTGSLQISKALFEAVETQESDAFIADDEPCIVSLKYCPVEDFDYNII